MSQKIVLPIEDLQVVDELVIHHFRKGVLIEEDRHVDLITNVGLEYIAKVLNGVSGNAFTYMAIGTGTTAPANGDTALEAEITTGGGARSSATCSYEADYKSKWVHTFNFTASFAVTEEGILDAVSDGNLLSRHTFTAKNVESGDSIEFTHKLTFSRA